MAHDISVEVNVNLSRFFNELPEEIFDEATMTQIHQALKEIMNPYVPKKSGDLRSNAIASAESVTYPGPYAAYQYGGIVYAPNIPIFTGGVITGWRSKAPKHPTGRNLEDPALRKLGTPHVWYDKLGNVIWVFGYSEPNTTDHWDKKAIAERGDKFYETVANIVQQRLREINGS